MYCNSNPHDVPARTTGPRTRRLLEALALSEKRVGSALAREELRVSASLNKRPVLEDEYSVRALDHAWSEE